MKLFSLSASSAVSISDSHPAHEPVFTQLRHAVRTLFSNLDQMGAAIAIGEAGDLDGAKELRKKHAGR